VARIKGDLGALEDDEAVGRLEFVNEIDEVLPFALRFQGDTYRLVIRAHFRSTERRVLNNDRMLLRDFLRFLQQSHSGTARISERRLLLAEEGVALEPEFALSAERLHRVEFRLAIANLAFELRVILLKNACQHVSSQREEEHADNHGERLLAGASLLDHSLP